MQLSDKPTLLSTIFLILLALTLFHGGDFVDALTAGCLELAGVGLHFVEFALAFFVQLFFRFDIVGLAVRVAVGLGTVVVTAIRVTHPVIVVSRFAVAVAF